MHVQNNVHANLHCGISATLIFYYKIARVALVSLANQPVFLCNQDVCAHTMGCKIGLSYITTGRFKGRGNQYILVGQDSAL